MAGDRSLPVGALTTLGVACVAAVTGVVGFAKLGETDLPIVSAVTALAGVVIGAVVLVATRHGRTLTVLAFTVNAAITAAWAVVLWDLATNHP